MLADDIEHLRQELDTMASRGQLPPNLKALRDDLDALNAPPATAGKGGVA